MSIGALAVAVAMLVALLTRTSSPVPSDVTGTQSGGTFGPHYPGLSRRLRIAGLPTMATATSAAHTHQSLAVYVDGRQVPVPENVGVDPSADAGDMAGLHTHAASFTIHNEGVRRPTLGQFFAVWGVELAPSELGDRRAGPGEQVKLWVNGKASTLLGRLPLTDGQRLVVSLGPENAPAPPVPPAPVA